MKLSGILNIFNTSFTALYLGFFQFILCHQIIAVFKLIIVFRFYSSNFLITKSKCHYFREAFAVYDNDDTMIAKLNFNSNQILVEI